MQLREPDERDIKEREALIEELNKVLAAAFPYPSIVTGRRPGLAHQWIPADDQTDGDIAFG